MFLWVISFTYSKKALAIKNNEILEKTLMPLALSYDHRVINGVDAGEFMQEVKKLMEDYLSGKDISDQYNNEIENMRNMDQNDRGLAMDMHNLIRGDESKCIIN